jgi:hypothetical protein
MTSVRAKAFVVVVVGIAMLIVGLACLPLFTSMSLNCWHEEVDICSGRVRWQLHLCGLCIYAKSEESILSSLIKGCTPERAPAWHRCETVDILPALCRNSLHYRYHSAIAQIRMLEVLWQLAAFTPNAKRQMCLDVLRLWQAARDDRLVEMYQEAAASLAISGSKDSKPIDVGQLPSVESIAERYAGKKAKDERKPPGLFPSGATTDPNVRK